MKKIYSILLGIFITPSVYSQSCTPPTVTVNPATICSNTSATLTANTTATIVKWYDSASATTPIFTGNPFTTPILNSTTNYWVEATTTSIGPEITGGKSSPGTSSSAVVSTTAPWGLAFTVSSDFIINTVDVFASANGNLVLELLDSNYAVIESRTIAITTGGTSTSPNQITIPVGFIVSAGNSYKLVARSSPSMRRDNSSNSFPYDLGGLGTITGGTINNSTTNSSSYYFFYNWKVAPISANCSSQKIQTTVNTTTTAVPIASSPQNFNPGDTLASLVANGQNLIWYSDAALTNVLPSTTPLVSGTTYYVTQTLNGCRSNGVPVVANQNLSVIEVSNASLLKVYPNPVSNNLHIDSKNTIKNILIFDPTGRLILNKEYNDKKINIPVEKLVKGKYIIKIETEKEIKSIPFVKE